MVVSYNGGPVPLDQPYGKVPILAQRMDERIEREIARALRDEERRREAAQRAEEQRARGARPR